LRGAAQTLASAANKEAAGELSNAARAVVRRVWTVVVVVVLCPSSSKRHWEEDRAAWYRILPGLERVLVLGLLLPGRRRSPSPCLLLGGRGISFEARPDPIAAPFSLD
jgi:hypothetical protein